jgi:HEAT repeat protein
METSNKKIECVEVQELLSEYLQLELSNEKSLAIEGHLKVCSHCNNELAKLKKLIELIDNAYEPEPPSYLKSQFSELINKEQATQQQGSTKLPISYTTRILVRVAAAIALLLVGNAIGLFTYPYLLEQSSKQEVAMIKQEVSSLKEALVLSMINQESASERVRALNMTTELSHLDNKLFAVLLETLNDDPSPNVRLSAAQALSRYMASEQVRDSLISSLHEQTNPLVQITLINIIVTSNAPHAAESLKQFAKSKDLMDEVKQLLDIQIKQLTI